MKIKFDAYHESVDKVCRHWLEQAHEEGLPLACTACKAPACCKQRLLAYEPEIELIVEQVKGHTELEERFKKWVQAFLELSPIDQLHASTPYRRDMWCPLYVGRRCAAYGVRPMVCRAHFALEDDESKCNSRGVVDVRLIETTSLHEPVMQEGLRALMMPLMVAAALFDDELGAAAEEKALWLEKEWAKEVERSVLYGERMVFQSDQA